MTLFGFLGPDAFVLGQHAFSMPAELTKTLLHELHRLSTSASKVEGASGALVAEETAAAFNFAEELYSMGVKKGIWKRVSDVPTVNYCCLRK